MVWSQRRPLRINALLKSIYTDLRHPASFSSPYTLFRAAKQKNPNILYKDVESWLETQPVYTKYRRIKVKYPRHKVLSRGLRYQYQADLVDYSALTLQQSVDVVVKYKCNVFAYVEGKIEACDCQ